MSTTSASTTTAATAAKQPPSSARKERNPLLGYGALFLAIALLPAMGVYPIFVMKVLCFALFACAFNLLIGFTGLLSFGHAAFLGTAAYATGHALKVWGLR